MLVTLLAATAAFSPAITPKVIGASLFKNGYAVVMREIPVSGSGDVDITDLPQATLGTLWISASSNIQIASVVKTSEQVKSDREAGSLEEILSANIGKSLIVVLQDSPKFAVDGVLLSASGSIVVIKTASDTVAYPKASIISVLSHGGTLVYKMPQETSRDVLRIHVTSTGPGKIFTVGLERGMTWSPSYAIDISDKKALSILAKSTVLDDLANLDHVEVKFVTGFPNVPWISFLDPLLSGSSVDQLTGMLQSVGQSREAKSQALMNQAAGRSSADEMAAAFPANPLPGIQAEDLFFYRQPNVTLKKGDRAYYVMFNAKSEYEHLYTLDLYDTVANNVEYRPISFVPEVWHSIKFKNTSGQPLTTAPATVFKDGEVIGQDTLDYTSVGAEALVRMAKGLDIHAEANEEEVTRERANLRLPNGTLYDLVTLKGTIVLQNYKPESVKMKINKDLTGEITGSVGSPKVTKTAKGLQEINSRVHLEWDTQVEPGKRLTLTYTYKLYVHSG